MTRMKICGVTCVRDALLCVEAGADALGLNFYRGSPRCISVDRGKEIAGALPPFVSLVGVFVCETAEDVARIASE